MIHEEEVKHFLTMAERAMRWKDSDPLRAMGALEKTAEVIMFTWLPEKIGAATCILDITNAVFRKIHLK